ncbi:MAG TPA: CerR family C-terminal domain-containing protein [Candidatus Polarisedimenticolia bacterium]
MPKSRVRERASPDRAPETRDRLLEAAEPLFAARGFGGTSMRALTAAARCNLAAVNYHFGGKTSLYREVIRRRLRAMREQRIASIVRTMSEAGAGADIDLLLRSFTLAFLEPHLDESSGRVLMQLMSREMLEPHMPPRTFEKEMLEPVLEALTRALRTIHPRLQARAARRGIHSLIAQLAHVVHMRRMPGFERGRSGADFKFPEVIDHIVRFSAAGLRAGL